MTKITPPTANDLAGGINAMMDFLELLDEKIDALQESVDTLTTKVDEINLPVGEGFSQEFES